MKSTEYTSTTLHTALIGLIVDDSVVAALANCQSARQDGLFNCDYADIIANWCISHYRKHGHAIGKHIQAVYQEWGESSHASRDVVKQIETLLDTLSRHYEREPGDSSVYLQAVETAINRRRVLKVREVLDSMNGKPQDAMEAIADFRPVHLTQERSVVPASSIASATTHWLWPQWCPLGAITVLDGDPGRGKTQLAIDLCARVTRGYAMPPHRARPGWRLAKREPISVLYLSAEDAASTVLVPRLTAARADLKRVHLLDSGAGADLTFPEGLGRLGHLITEHAVGLVVIDPFFGFLGFKVEANSDHRLRTVLAPLARLAERHGAAVLLLRHLNKKSDEPAMYRGGGSIALSAQARAAWIVGRDPSDDNVRILASLKSSLGPPPPPLAYRIIAATVEASDGEDIETSRIEWLGERPDVDAQDIVRHKKPEQGRPSKLPEVVSCIRELLADGKRMPSDELTEAVCDRMDCSPDTVKRARNEAGVAVHKGGFRGGWECYLP